MCILPTLRSVSFKNNPLRLDQRSFPKRTIKDKCPRKVHGCWRGNKLKKSLENYSSEKPYYTRGLYFHCYDIDCIDEEASQNTRCILYKSKKR